MAFKPIDPKRDEYRRYLERGGIIESLTKVFVRILKERPEDPTQYLLQNLGDARLQADNIAYLQSELDDARNEINRLTQIIRGINPDLLLEPTSNNDPINNDKLSESIDLKEVVDETNQVHFLAEQNLQANGDYSEIANINEGVQNINLAEKSDKDTSKGDAVEMENTSTIN